jgi:micrococcal nuclease
VFSDFRAFVALQTQPAMHACLTTLILTFTALACAASRQPMADCVVQRVSDGDSFRCQDGSRVRLIGIDSPERQQHPFGQQAAEALLRIMPPGTNVKLESDAAPTDRYGRILAHVWVGSILVNEAMVQGGWALLYTVPPNVKYADRLERAQKEARARGAGLWAGRAFACLPAEFRRGQCVSLP